VADVQLYEDLELLDTFQQPALSAVMQVRWCSGLLRAAAAAAAAAARSGPRQQQVPAAVVWIGQLRIAATRGSGVSWSCSRERGGCVASDRATHASRYHVPPDPDRGRCRGRRRCRCRCRRRRRAAAAAVPLLPRLPAAGPVECHS